MCPISFKLRTSKRIYTLQDLTIEAAFKLLGKYLNEKENFAIEEGMHTDGQSFYSVKELKLQNENELFETVPDSEFLDGILFKELANLKKINS